MSVLINSMRRFLYPAPFRAKVSPLAYGRGAMLALFAFLVAGCGSDVDSDSEYAKACENVHCDAPYRCVAYYGIAGPNGGLLAECAIPCKDDPNVCPEGTTCGSFADGPQDICL